MRELIEDAMRFNGLAHIQRKTSQVGRTWSIGQYPDGIWIAACPGGGPQWWNGEGRWRVEHGNNMLLLRAIKRGPPNNYNALDIGLSADEWVDLMFVQ